MNAVYEQLSLLADSFKRDSNVTFAEFSGCVYITVFWLETAWFWLCAPVYVWNLCRSQHRTPLAASRIYYAKQSVAALQLAIWAATLQGTDSGDETLPPAYSTGAVIETITLMLVMLLVALERRRGISVSSGLLFMHWTLASFKQILMACVLFSQTEHIENGRSQFRISTSQFAMCLVQLVLCCLPEQMPLLPDKQRCPEYRASFLSKITNNWLNGLLVLGHQRALTPKDMYHVDARHQSHTVDAMFMKKWEHKLAAMKTATRNDEYAKPGKYSGQYRQVQKRMEIKNAAEKDGCTGKSVKQDVPLLTVLLSTFGIEMLVCHFWRLTAVCVEFIHPILLGKFIEIAEDTSTDPWKGHVLCVAFLCNLLIKTLLQNKYYIQMNMLSFRIRSCLESAIYKKILTMNNKARAKSTLGEIVNVISVDVAHIREYFMWVTLQLWVGPVKLVITMVLLYQRVGWAVLAGVGVILVMMPVNTLIAKKMKRLEAEQKGHKDRRIKLLVEVLNGIKILKLYAWEMAFADKVTDIRNDELRTQLRQNTLDAAASFCWSVTPFCVSLTTFTAYIFLSESNQIGAQTIFVCLLLFGKLTATLDVISRLFMETPKLQVSLRRIEHLLHQDDTDITNVSQNPSDDAVSITHGTFYWDQALGPCLKNINLVVPKGSLVAIVGTVGAGKSSLISAMLGQIEKQAGHVNISGQVAYVPQQAWIQNDTLQNNILFTKPMNTAKYERVMDACALTADLEVLQAKDKTLIGEKGINLSGGQRQRVSLARAVYFNSDIYLLDDPLSAVDSHVGKHIFEHVIGSDGLLRNKTRILVTHGIRWLPSVDKIYVVSGGTISESGTYEELMEHDGPFAKFMDTYVSQNDDSDSDDEAIQFKNDTLMRLHSLRSNESTHSQDEDDNELDVLITNSLNYINTPCDKDGTQIRQRKRSDRSRCNSETSGSAPKQRARQPSLTLDTDKEISATPIDNLINNPNLVLRSISTVDQEDACQPEVCTANQSDGIIDEAVETSDKMWAVAMWYMSALGTRMYVVVLSLYILHHMLELWTGALLTSWTSDAELNNMTLTPADSQSRHELNTYYLKIYASVGLCQAIITFVHTCIYARMNKKVSEKLHRNMLTSVVRAPMTFFDTTPSGKIIDRFSRDIDSADARLPYLIKYIVICLMSFVTSFCFILYTTPGFIVIVVPTGFLCFLIQKYLLPTKRQLRRLERITRSPIYNHFAESINGVNVIRAYGVQDRFTTETHELVDRHRECGNVIMIMDRWLAMRLEGIGALLVFTTAFVTMYNRQTLGGALVGLLMNYALAIEGKVNWLIHLVAALQVRLVDVERIEEYTALASEADLKTDREPGIEWPKTGVVEMESYSVRYRDGLDTVLRNVDISVKAGEKIGIVGRTGAGKSSLALSLFRMLEPASGRIIVDGEDICKLGLHDLRSRLAILPQEPVIFSGSMRVNLDPMCEHTDETIFTALRHAHLKAFVDSLPGKLQFECGEGGQNLSVGQRQLVCLARSLLRKSKVLVLDEATAAVDMETDDLIQQTIRTEFSDSTVLAIAHRLNTVIDYDRILVLENGEVKEFDSPKRLLQNSNSKFFGLAKDAGLV